MKSNPSHNFNLPIIIITIVAVVFRTFTFVLLSYRRYYVHTLQATQAAASNDILEMEQKIAELQLRVCILTLLYIFCVCLH